MMNKPVDTVYLPTPVMVAAAPVIYPSFRPRRLGLSLNAGVNYNGDIFKPQVNGGFIYFFK